MFKKTKIAAAIALAATMTMGLSGCNDESTTSADNSNVVAVKADQAKVTGYVVDSYEMPVEGVAVSIDGVEAITNAMGIYVFEAVKVTGFKTNTQGNVSANPVLVSFDGKGKTLSGRMEVEVESTNIVFSGGADVDSAAGLAIAIQEGVTVNAGKVILPEVGALFDGNVMNKDTGQPLADTSISLVFDSINNSAIAAPFITKTDEDGYFSYDDLPVNSLFTITVSGMYNVASNKVKTLGKDFLVKANVTGEWLVTGLDKLAPSFMRLASNYTATAPVNNGGIPDDYAAVAKTINDTNGVVIPLTEKVQALLSSDVVIKDLHNAGANLKNITFNSTANQSASFGKSTLADDGKSLTILVSLIDTTDLYLKDAAVTTAMAGVKVADEAVKVADKAVLDAANGTAVEKKAAADKKSLADAKKVTAEDDSQKATDALRKALTLVMSDKAPTRKIVKKSDKFEISVDAASTSDMAGNHLKQTVLTITVK